VFSTHKTHHPSITGKLREEVFNNGDGMDNSLMTGAWEYSHFTTIFKNHDYLSGLPGSVTQVHFSRAG